MAGDFEPGGIQTFIRGIESSHRRLKCNIDAIIEKYNKPFVNDDEINLSTLSIHTDNGSLRRFRGCYKLGTAPLRSTKRKDELLKSQMEGKESYIDSNVSMAITRQYNCYLRKPDNRDGEPSDAETLDSDSSHEDDDEDEEEEEESKDSESGSEEDLEKEKVSEKLKDAFSGRISMVAEGEREDGNECGTGQVRESDAQSDGGQEVDTSGGGQVNECLRKWDHESRREKVTKARRVLLHSLREPDSLEDVANEGNEVQLQSRKELGNDGGRELANESETVLLKTGRKLASESEKVQLKTGGKLASESEQPKSRRKLTDKSRSVQQHSGRGLANQSEKVQLKTGAKLASESEKVQLKTRAKIACESEKVQLKTRARLACESEKVQLKTRARLACESEQPKSSRKLAIKSGSVQLQSRRDMTKCGDDQVDNGRKEQSSKSSDEQNSQSRKHLVIENGQEPRGVKISTSASDSFTTSNLDNTTSSSLKNLSFVSYQSPKRVTKETSRKEPAVVSSVHKQSTIHQNRQQELNETTVVDSATLSPIKSGGNNTSACFSFLNPDSQKSGLALRKKTYVLTCESMQNDSSVNVNTTKMSGSSRFYEDSISRSNAQLSSNIRNLEKSLQKNTSTVNLRNDLSENMEATYTKSGLGNFSVKRGEPASELKAASNSDTNGCERTFSELHLSSTSDTRRSESVALRTTRFANVRGDLGIDHPSSFSKMSTSRNSDAYLNKISAPLSSNLQADSSIIMDVTYNNSEMFTASSRRKDLVSKSRASSNSVADIDQRPHSKFNFSTSGTVRYEDVSRRTTRSATTSSNWNTDQTTSTHKMSAVRELESNLAKKSLCSNLQADYSENMDVTYEKSARCSASGRLQGSDSEACSNSDTESYGTPLSDLKFCLTSDIKRNKNLKQRTTTFATTGSSLKTDHASSSNSLSTTGKPENVKKLAAALFSNSQTDSSRKMDVTYDKYGLSGASSRRKCSVSESQTSSSSATETDKRPLSELSLSSTSVSQRHEDVMQRPSCASCSFQTDCQNSDNVVSTHDVQKSKFCRKSLANETIKEPSCVDSARKSHNPSTRQPLSNTGFRQRQVSPRKSSASSFQAQSTHFPGRGKSAGGYPSRPADILSETDSVLEALDSSMHKYNLRSKTLGSVQEQSASQSLGDDSLTSSLQNLKIYTQTARTILSPPSGTPAHFTGESGRNLVSPHNNLTSPPVKLTSSSSSLVFQHGNLASPQTRLTSRRRNLKSPQTRLTTRRRNLESPPSSMAIPRSSSSSPHLTVESPSVILAPSHFSEASSPSSVEIPFFSTVPQQTSSSSLSCNREPPQTHFTTLRTSDSTQNSNKKRLIQHADSEFSDEHVEDLVKCGLFVGSPNHVQKGIQTEPHCQSINNLCSYFHQFLLFHGFDQDKWTSGCETLAHQSSQSPTCCRRETLAHQSSQSPTCCRRETLAHQSSQSPTCCRRKRKAPDSFTSGYFTDISSSPKRMQTCSTSRLGGGCVFTPPSVKTKCSAEPTCHLQDHTPQQACLTELCCFHGTQQTTPEKETLGHTCCHPVGHISRQEVSKTDENFSRRFAVARKHKCSGSQKFANPSSSVQQPVVDNWYCLNHQSSKEDWCSCLPSRTDSRGSHWVKASTNQNNPEVTVLMSPHTSDSRVCEWVQASRCNTNQNPSCCASCCPKIQQNQLPHCQLVASDHVSSPQRSSRTGSTPLVSSCLQSAHTENKKSGFEGRIRNLAGCQNHNHASPCHNSVDKIPGSSGDSSLRNSVDKTAGSSGDRALRNSVDKTAGSSGDRALRNSVEKLVHAVWQEIQAERDSADTPSRHLGGNQNETYISDSSGSCGRGSKNEASGKLDESVDARLGESGARGKIKNRGKQTSRLHTPKISSFLSSSLNKTAVELPSFVENNSPSPKFKVPKNQPPRLRVDPQNSMFPESLLQQFSPLNPARRDSDRSVLAYDQKKSSLPGRKSNNSKTSKDNLKKSDAISGDSKVHDGQINRTSQKQQNIAPTTASALSETFTVPGTESSGQSVFSSAGNSRHIYKHRNSRPMSKHGSLKTSVKRASTPVRTEYRLPDFCLDDTLSTIISTGSVIDNRVGWEDTLVAESDSFEEIDLV